ncbi:MAG: hypothetical protein AB1726_13580 [Planctomycetota bacterium]
MDATNLGDLATVRSDALGSLAGARIDAVRRTAEEGRTAEAAQAFETLLAAMLVTEMRRAMPEGFFGDGTGADVYGSWFDAHLGAALAERDALGFAGIVKEDLLRLQAAREAGKNGEARDR